MDPDESTMWCRLIDVVSAYRVFRLLQIIMIDGKYLCRTTGDKIRYQMLSDRTGGVGGGKIVGTLT